MLSNRLGMNMLQISCAARGSGRTDGTQGDSFRVDLQHEQRMNHMRILLTRLRNHYGNDEESESQERQSTVEELKSKVAS